MTTTNVTMTGVLLFDGDAIGHVDAIDVSRDFVDAGSYSPEIDPGWRYVDAAGHAHRWGRNSRLRWPGVRVATPGEIAWCEECRDYHEIGGEVVYQCVRCGETLAPGYRQPTTMTRIMTSRKVELTATIDNDVIDDLWRLVGHEATIEVVHNSVRRILGTGIIKDWQRTSRGGTCTIRIIRQ